MPFYGNYLLPPGTDITSYDIHPIRESGDGKKWVCIRQMLFSLETETEPRRFIKNVYSKRITAEDLFRYLTPDTNPDQR
jgi:hypothetical protein